MELDYTEQELRTYIDSEVKRISSLPLKAVGNHYYNLACICNDPLYGEYGKVFARTLMADYQLFLLEQSLEDLWSIYDSEPIREELPEWNNIITATLEHTISTEMTFEIFVSCAAKVEKCIPLDKTEYMGDILVEIVDNDVKYKDCFLQSFAEQLCKASDLRNLCIFCAILSGRTKTEKSVIIEGILTAYLSTYSREEISSMVSKLCKGRNLSVMLRDLLNSWKY